MGDEIMDWGFAEVVPSPHVFEAWQEVGAVRVERSA